MELSKKKIGKYGAWTILILTILVYVFYEPFNSYINQIFMLFSLDVEVIKGYIRSYGPYAMVISFFLMVFQSIAAPLPAFLITFANAAIFGWWQGAILSWSSAMVGAILCFYISRILGRDVAEKLAGKGMIKSVDSFFEKYGSYTILICRLLPFVSFDIVSYAAGLTGMGFVAFFVATGVGQLPATIVYSYVGGMLTGTSRTFITGLFIFFGLSILGLMLKKIFDEKKNVKERKQNG
ncbi:MAG: TVP38/TMEM64 family protein [Filifactoraceae bacterium]